MRRRTRVLLVMLIVLVLPPAVFAYFSWQYPVNASALTVAVYNKLPAGVRTHPAMWRLVSAYLIDRVEEKTPYDVQRFLRRKQRPDYVVVALGDSTTQGSQVAPNKRWTFLLQKSMKSRLRRSVKVINAGIAGEIAAQGARRLERDVLALQPDLAIVGYLVNDGRVFGVDLDGRGQTLVDFDDYQAAMVDLLSRLRARGIPVMLFTCQPIQPAFFGLERMHWATVQDVVFTSRLTALKQRAGELGTPVVETYEAIVQQPEQSALYGADNIHLNEVGHKLVSKLMFAAWVERLLPALTEPAEAEAN
ncbi:MAG TPA: GDSL-type esterase/lipase family protein [bacterium]|nr:GDSL-type esterase/lipase family protein [bacterium]